MISRIRFCLMRESHRALILKVFKTVENVCGKIREEFRTLPKGVIQTHGTANHFVMNFTNDFRISPVDRFCFLYSFSVSPAARQIFAALLNGASLFPFNINQEGLSGLANWLIQHQITFYSSVPTLFRYFVDALKGEESFSSLRLIKLVGEPVYCRDVELYKKHFSPTCLFVNCLGSTETGITRSCFIDKQTQIDENYVPVGYAVQDKKISLEGEDCQAVRTGEVGEIVVKSQFLSKGYWRNSERTKTVFLSDPEGGRGRIYRTGDLGRLMPDGRLVHLGRKDFQIKVRGFRIEPVEIEMALLRSEAVKEVVIQTLKNDLGEQRLVAYIVPAVKRPLTVSELRSFIEEELPEYMIPYSFVVIEAFPLTSSGKIDRQALPNPGYDRPLLDVPFIAPRTSFEKEVVKIWSDVLGLERVGIYDPFLELGGILCVRPRSSRGFLTYFKSISLCKPSWRRLPWLRWRKPLFITWPIRPVAMR